jgi:hypothetical protein
VKEAFCLARSVTTFISITSFTWRLDPAPRKKKNPVHTLGASAKKFQTIWTHPGLLAEPSRSEHIREVLNKIEWKSSKKEKIINQVWVWKISGEYKYCPNQMGVMS